MSKQRENILAAEGFSPVRERLKIEAGAYVRRDGLVYRIAQVLDFETVIGVEVESGRSASLRIGELRPLGKDGDTPAVDLDEIADENWKIAEYRYSVIKPFIDRALVQRHQVEERGKEFGVDPATIYRWLKKYNALGVLSALIPKRRGWQSGKTRIPPHADEVVCGVITNFYLTAQRPTVQKAVTEVMRVCHDRGIKAPCASTVRARIAKLSEKERLRGRGFKEKAKNKFFPAAGKFPNADYPLAVVQIDHTPVDVILVDDVHRKPIGRPWITLAIDVFSRVVTGYYLSFDPPSETSVGMCVSQAILPKEDWMVMCKVEASWDVWGIPVTIHVDNGADFRSDNFRQSCLMYGINLEFRPVKQPRYGGHIERLLGTLLNEIHDLPGTTFSSIKEREGYDAEKNAVLTKSEFENWLVTLITKIYHNRPHSVLGMTPLKKWEIGIFGNSEVKGIGLPARSSDRLAVMLDFLPSFRRTVQTFGVKIDGMTYYAEALRPWINATDPTTKRKKELVFRRDPRDISTVWFFDPALGQYFKIPFADQTLPACSVWEYRQAREHLKREGLANFNQAEIFRAIGELRERVEEASGRTKKARRMAQRRKEHEKKVTPAAPVQERRPVPQLSSPASMLTELLDDEIKGLGDIA